ncbi:hypothetical protein HDC94_001068 [Leifsonia sp. AK011]|uniref:hypothetical protein n=1 Tax=Leifsonia sp. AK011 TaxID=2723075 RepID=UPI0015C98537|nr:hypothetical protein [Leifsonia sp. AK011]NYF09912.1 hypothetical protein [Leifsonia sp. AK011]
MRDYLPKLRGRYRVAGVVFFCATVAWGFGLLVSWTIVRPSAVWMVLVGVPILYAGTVVIVSSWVLTLYFFRAPLRARVAELTADDKAVFCITLDPLWTPVGSTSDVVLGPGFLIVDGHGMRIVDDAVREILVVDWSNVVALRPGRAPKPVAELELDRNGDITRWWFYVFGPGAFRRRGRHGITRFVRQVNTFRPPAGFDDG